MPTATRLTEEQRVRILKLKAFPIINALAALLGAWIAPSLAAPAPQAQSNIEEVPTETEADKRYVALPKRISAALSSQQSKCGYVGVEIAVANSTTHLWVASATSADCMGSAGSYIVLIAETAGAKPRVVLDDGPELQVDIDQSNMANGLPQVVIEGGGNCCGTERKYYGFDGKKYQETGESSWEGDLQIAAGVLGSNGIPAAVRAGLQGLAAKKGCEEGVGELAADVGLLLVASICDDGTEVWIITKPTDTAPAAFKTLARETLPGADRTDVKIHTDRRTSSADITLGSVNWHFVGGAGKRSEL
jgi:hypothetical protein